MYICMLVLQYMHMYMYIHLHVHVHVYIIMHVYMHYCTKSRSIVQLHSPEWHCLLLYMISVITGGKNWWYKIKRYNVNQHRNEKMFG